MDRAGRGEQGGLGSGRGLSIRSQRPGQQLLPDGRAVGSGAWRGLWTVGGGAFHSGTWVGRSGLSAADPGVHSPRAVGTRCLPLPRPLEGSG